MLLFVIIFIINIINVKVAWMFDVTLTSTPGLGCTQSNLQLVKRALSSILHNPNCEICSSLGNINFSRCVDLYLHCLHLTDWCKSV
jgi:hypothetical protein